MLKVTHLENHGWEAAIRGMRNPLNSWDKSDTLFIEPDGTYHTITGASGPYCGSPSFVSQGFELGKNDLALMCKLVKAGPDHAKFLRQISISMDILAPLYWWKEFDTYRVGVAQNPTDIEYNSTSTMHKIASKEFTREDFSCEHLFGVGDLYFDHEKEHFQVMEVDGEEVYWSPADVLDITIQSLNFYRDLYLKTGDKRYWWQLIQQLPSTYNYLRTMTFNYAAARNMYHARCNHKLDEWHQLCRALEELPYASELIVE